MALKSTIYKAQINIANLDHHLYLDQNLTLAQHPSETDRRMMLRLLAWCLFADEELVFTKGLCDVEEPALWKKNLVDEIQTSIELGLPDEKRVRKASHRSKQVVILAYDNHAAPVWWEQNKAKITSYKNVSVIFINDEVCQQLETMIERTMQWQCTIESGQIWLSVGEKTIELNPVWWLDQYQA